MVDYRQTNGVYYIQDVYAGPGLAGVPRGTIKHLRVVALEFRAAGVGNNGSGGPGGGALISTPVAIGNGTWDVKKVLGDAAVQEDGSAAFIVPARTPVYFQALDEKGYAVQTMRSWSTLQPGEVSSCVGCHEPKNSAPLPRPSLAQRLGPQALTPFYGPARGFSFRKEIQPILESKCISCHDDRQQRMVARAHPAPPAGQKAFSLLATENDDRMALRKWSDAYLALTQARPDQDDWARGAFRGDNRGRVVNWIGSQSVPSALPPYFAGAVRSELLSLLERGHYQVVMTREEMEKIACWIDLLVPFCGDYYEAGNWTEGQRQKYDRFAEKRRQMEALERANLEAFMEQSGRPVGAVSPHYPGAGSGREASLESQIKSE
jgi:cytochrome c553